MSSGGVDISVEIALLQDHVLAHDQPMGRHFLQCRQDAAHMLVRVHENDDHRQLPSGVHKMAGLNLLTAEESRYRMQRGRRIHIFLRK